MKTDIKQKESICPSCDLSEFCARQSDREIVEYVKANKECYSMLMERYEDKLSRYVRRISGVSAESVEDILQDVFMKVFINLNAYDSRMEFSSWIYRITHNETINYWRKHKKRKDLVVSLDANEALKNVIGDKQDVENEVMAKINGERVAGMLDRVDERYRVVLAKNYIEGKSYREIAEELGSPIGTIGTLLNRGKKMLKVELEKTGFGQGALAS